MPDRTPQRLLERYESWRASPELMKGAAPTQVFAVFGRARVTGRLTPEEEDRLLGKLITHWALRSTLDIAELCATQPAQARRPPAPTPSTQGALALTV